MISTGQIELAAKQVLDRCDQLAQLSDVPGQTTRTFCCPSMKKAHRMIARWMEAAGLRYEIDAVGNLVGQSGVPGRPVVMIGSHLDTVVNAGKYDGVLGVMLGLAVAELIGQSNQSLNFELMVVGFSEEEGVRFNRPYIGSSAIAGCFEPAVLDLTDEDGISVAGALAEFGCDPDQWSTASLVNQDLIAFIEPHIEQGPVLQSKSQAVGVVSAIAGQTRATIQINGTAGHAGTVPHTLRHDALAAAAELILVIERLGQQTEGLVATVGKLEVSPNASNVIPGQAIFTLDLRHAEDPVRHACFQRISDEAFQVASHRSLQAGIQTNLDQPAVLMDYHITQALSDAIQSCGCQACTLPSGAGHDAAMMAKLGRSAMMFIRCRDGISHRPEEHVDLEDVSIAIEVLLETLQRISVNVMPHGRQGTE